MPAAGVETTPITVRLRREIFRFVRSRADLASASLETTASELIELAFANEKPAPMEKPSPMFCGRGEKRIPDDVGGSRAPSPGEVQRILFLCDEGVGVPELAVRFNRGKSTIRRIIEARQDGKRVPHFVHAKRRGRKS